jgi:hypothetical protein
MTNIGVMEEWEYSCDKCNWIHNEEQECGD